MFASTVLISGVSDDLQTTSGTRISIFELQTRRHDSDKRSHKILQHKRRLPMNRSIEQALTSMIPRYNGFLPPELIELASSLLAQSRSKASNLKAEEEIGRTYACANIACERSVISIIYDYKTSDNSLYDADLNNPSISPKSNPTHHAHLAFTTNYTPIWTVFLSSESAVALPIPHQQLPRLRNHFPAGQLLQRLPPLPRTEPLQDELRAHGNEAYNMRIVRKMLHPGSIL